METAANLNEQIAETAFSKQSGVFDALYSDNTIINYKRKRVREHILRYLKPGSHILELNSGTGEDALFFARKALKYTQQIFQRACRTS
jgi:ubiquinone/menaquinone biosynthesis C-methylase UbiE